MGDKAIDSGAYVHMLDRIQFENPAGDTEILMKIMIRRGSALIVALCKNRERGAQGESETALSGLVLELA